MRKKVIFWILAVLISLGTMVYQRLTGPTYEKRYKITQRDTIYEFELPRSHGGDSDCPIELELPSNFEGKIIWRKYPTENPWETIQMESVEGKLVAALPHQPPAGKLEYHLELMADNQVIELGDEQNVVVRFKGSVPAWAQIPHILLDGPNSHLVHRNHLFRPW